MKENMKSLVKKGRLSKKEERALNKLIAELRASWPGTIFKLFGSKAIGKFDEESDVDILILLPCHVSKKIREQIIDIIFEINLKFGSNISPLIMSEKEWDSGFIPLLPIHQYVEEEGVVL